MNKLILMLALIVGSLSANAVICESGKWRVVINSCSSKKPTSVFIRNIEVGGIPADCSTGTTKATARKSWLGFGSKWRVTFTADCGASASTTVRKTISCVCN